MRLTSASEAPQGGAASELTPLEAAAAEAADAVGTPAERRYQSKLLCCQRLAWMCVPADPFIADDNTVANAEDWRSTAGSDPEEPKQRTLTMVVAGDGAVEANGGASAAVQRAPGACGGDCQCRPGRFRRSRDRCACLGRIAYRLFVNILIRWPVVGWICGLLALGQSNNLIAKARANGGSGQITPHREDFCGGLPFLLAVPGWSCGWPGASNSFPDPSLLPKLGSPGRWTVACALLAMLLLRTFSGTGLVLMQSAMERTGWRSGEAARANAMARKESRLRMRRAAWRWDVTVVIGTLLVVCLSVGLGVARGPVLLLLGGGSYDDWQRSPAGGTGVALDLLVRVASSVMTFLAAVACASSIARIAVGLESQAAALEAELIARKNRALFILPWEGQTRDSGRRRSVLERTANQRPPLLRTREFIVRHATLTRRMGAFSFAVSTWVGATFAAATVPLFLAVAGGAGSSAAGALLAAAAVNGVGSDDSAATSGASDEAGCAGAGATAQLWLLLFTTVGADVVGMTLVASWAVMAQARAAAALRSVTVAGTRIISWHPDSIGSQAAESWDAMEQQSTRSLLPNAALRGSRRRRHPLQADTAASVGASPPAGPSDPESPAMPPARPPLGSVSSQAPPGSPGESSRRIRVPVESLHAGGRSSSTDPVVFCEDATEVIAYASGTLRDAETPPEDSLARPEGEAKKMADKDRFAGPSLSFWTPWGTPVTWHITRQWLMAFIMSTVGMVGLSYLVAAVAGGGASVGDC